MFIEHPKIKWSGAEFAKALKNNPEMIGELQAVLMKEAVMQPDWIFDFAEMGGIATVLEILTPLASISE